MSTPNIKTQKRINIALLAVHPFAIFMYLCVMLPMHIILKEYIGIVSDIFCIVVYSFALKFALMTRKNIKEAEGMLIKEANEINNKTAGRTRF